MEKSDPRTGDAIAQWYERKLGDGFQLRSVKKIGRRFMEVVESERGEMNRLAFLRQNSVIIIPVIETRGKLFTILGSEYREGAAKEMLGFPAGSMDKDGEDILEVAKRELLEEMPVEEDWIVGLSEIDTGEHNYASPGGTNEQVFSVRADVRLPDDVDIHDLTGSVNGVAEENEYITAQVRELNRDLLNELDSLGAKLGLMVLLEDL